MRRMFAIGTLLSALCVLPASAILDTNSNSLSDLWERAYNGDELFPVDVYPYRPGDDPDGDGWTNEQEAAAGTNPFDPNPPDGIIRPDIVHIPAVWIDTDLDEIPDTISTPEAITVTWPQIPGKSYTLLFSPDLVEWLPVGEAFIGSETEQVYSFPLSQIEGQDPPPDKQFWRVKVEDVDSDGDGLTDAEEMVLGTNPSQAETIAGYPDIWLATHFLNTLLNGGASSFDPNGDPDDDGYTNEQEAFLGTDPNTANTPVTGKIGQESIVNGDFSSPAIGTGLLDPHESGWDYWGAGDVMGWSAVVGDNIELQNITPKIASGQYVELKAHPEGHRGIKQEVGTRKGMTYLLAVDCRDRADVAPACSNFDIVIDGVIKRKIRFDNTETDILIINVPPGAWKTVLYSFTAENPITWISLVPTNTLDDTTGCLIDNVMLTPVDITVREKLQTDTPVKGLCVKKGTMITFDFNGVKPASDFPAAALVNWRTRQIQQDGNFADWVDVPGECCELDFDTPTPGIFQVKAVLTLPNMEVREFEYVRKKDAPNAKDGGDNLQDLHKKGAPDYFGVAEKDWQLSVRNAAVAYLGSTVYAKAAACQIYPGVTSPPNISKCNIFVYHRCNEGGASVPLVRWHNLKHLPPFAIDWNGLVIDAIGNESTVDEAGRTVDTRAIAGWMSVSRAVNPQPGWVVARSCAWETANYYAKSPPNYSSHVGIMDYDGSWLAAGPASVNKYCHLQSGSYQPARFKLYTSQ